MLYVSGEGLTKSFGINLLFENVNCHVQKGDRIALVARNGSGKSTLLKILSGLETVDSGKVTTHRDVRVIFLDQTGLFKEGQSILDAVFNADNPIVQLIKKYEQAADENDSGKLNDLTLDMDNNSAWDFESKAHQILSRLNIHQLHRQVNTLSGGEMKRVAIARALIDLGFESKHAVLMLDEPTNHLDVTMVEWLENYLNKSDITLVLVTHDRYFLDRVCNVIWEIEAAEFYIHKGNYQDYLYNKSVRESNALSEIDKAKNLYKRELEWMRKMPKARSTKSKSRIDAFSDVEQLAKTRIEDQTLSLQSKTNRLGGKVVEMKKVHKSFDGKTIVSGFEYRFHNNERVGVIGKNGIGKTTFINLIQGTVEPDAGKITIGDTVTFGHYSQGGLEYKEDKRILDYVRDIAEQFTLADGTSLNAAQFLNLFLFKGEKQQTFISKLSGGEKRRLHLLGILFKNPNFLILDEPTNDLDLQTLGVLEEFISVFKGAVIIISHDRYFMDKLVNHLFVFEGDGVIRDFPGNYTDYRNWLNANESENRKKEITAQVSTKPESAPQTKLTYMEKREFDSLQKEIETLMAEKKVLELTLADTSADYRELAEKGARLKELIREIDIKELRWLELSERI